jgi:hypothetical protein
VCSAYVKTTFKDASNATDPITRLDVLVKRIFNWTGLGTLLPSTSVPLTSYESFVCSLFISVATFLKDVISWLHQARNDLSLPSTQVEAWSSSLEVRLRQATARYDFAKLFGCLMNG